MNLIICATPLHVLIAERIISLYPGEGFFGVMIGYPDNTKYQYYFQRLQRLCAGSQFITELEESNVKIARGKLKKMIYYWCVKKAARLPLKRFDKVFAGGIHLTIFQAILSAIHFQQLMTFDDGTINILPDSLFYQPDPVKKRKTWPCKIRYSLYQIRQMSGKHYTIFPDRENIVSAPEPINLLPAGKAGGCATNPVKTVTILLGQPLLEILAQGMEKNQRLMSKIIEKWQIACYFPHPREKSYPNNARVIESELIFEDYLLMEMANNPDTEYTLYTTGSSAALNVIHFPRVRVILIQPEGIETLLSWYHDLLRVFADFKVETCRFHYDIYGG